MDRVDSPEHYNYAQLEVIDIIEMFKLNFSRGNVVKYTLRAGHKQEQGLDEIQKEIEDLEKARWYLAREVQRLQKLAHIKPRKKGVK